MAPAVVVSSSEASREFVAEAGVETPEDVALPFESAPESAGTAVLDVIMAKVVGA